MDPLASSLEPVASSIGVPDSTPTEQPPLDASGRPMVRWGGFTWVTVERREELRQQLIARNKAGPQVKDEAELDEGFRKLVQWVLRHIDDEAEPRGSSKEGKALLTWAKANRGDFFGKYVPLLVRGEKAKDEEPEDEAVASNIELIEEWFRQRRDEVCPTCHRSGWKPGMGATNGSS